MPKTPWQQKQKVPVCSFCGLRLKTWKVEGHDRVTYVWCSDCDTAHEKK